MRSPVVLAGVLCFTLLPGAAVCQSSRPADDSTQARKQWELGARDRDPEKRDGSINDKAVLSYVQQLADRLSAAGSIPAVRVRVTAGTEQYFSFSPRRVLYLSAGLFARIEDEAELAGILAHGLAHLESDGACVLDPFRPPDRSGEWREHEKHATQLAVSYLKTSGFDPTSLLSLLSKLAYEHPAWGQAIHSDDLAELRDILENEPLPPRGYRLDSSDFASVHTKVEGMVAAEKPALKPALRSSR